MSDRERAGSLALLASPENPGQRRRAPREDGRRTTLRVPDALEEIAREVAREQGTTRNHALVLLAELGAVSYERARERERMRERQLRAFHDDRAKRAGAQRLPTLEEMQEAVYGSSERA